MAAKFFQKILTASLVWNEALLRSLKYYGIMPDNIERCKSLIVLTLSDANRDMANFVYFRGVFDNKLKNLA